MTGRLASGLLSVVVALVLASPALAQPGDKEVQANQAKAAELVQKGIQLQTKRDIDGAVALYRQAYCLIPEPVLVYNMGTAYQEGGKPADAISYFRYYLKIAPGGDLAQEAKNAIKMLQQGGTKTDATASIVCEARQPACLDGSQPVDGKCKGAPVVKPPKTCGEDEVLENGECVPAVTGGGVGIMKPPPPPKKSNTLLYAGIGTTAGGAIVLGLGIMYGIKAQNASDALTNNMDGWTPALLAKQQEGKDAETKQIIFTTAGGVLVAGGAALLFFHWKKGKSAETSAWVPYVDGDQAGIALTGRY